MIGQGVLRECLLDSEVARVVTVSRRPTGQKHRKLSELVHPDLATLASLEPQLTGFDACFFCAGVSALGKTEEEYTRWTYDLTMGVLPFRAAYMFRPGAVMPLHGIRSSTRWYNVMYAGIRPLYPILSRLAPAMITTTERLGRAMIAVARNGYATHVLEMADINRLSTPGRSRK